LFILQIQLNTKYETTELFNIILLLSPKPISPKAKNHHTGIINKIFYIDKNFFTDDFQYLFLYIDKISDISSISYIFFSEEIIPFYSKMNLIVLSKQQIMDIKNKTLYISFRSVNLTFEFQFKSDINLYFFATHPANLQINIENTFIETYIIFYTQFYEKSIGFLQNLYGDSDYFIINQLSSINDIFNDNNYQKF
jgi:hypothetical protein